MSIPRSGRRTPALLALMAGLVLLPACDALDRALRVEAPGFIDASDLGKPENAHLLVTGTIADFECALGAYIVNGGVLGNELRDASVTAGRFSLDRRDITNSAPYGVNSCQGNPPGIYVPLSTAVWSSNNAITRLEGWTDAEVQNRQLLIAIAAAYSGYSHVLMGEGFCSTVITELGPVVTPAQVFAAAEQRFTRALDALDAFDATSPTGSAATQSADIRNLAQLGRARARLNLENTADAQTDAEAVLARDPAYQKLATASATNTRRYNRVADEFFGGRITVDPSFRGLTINGDPDPRVVAIDTETLGHDTNTPVWVVAKHGDSRVAGHRSRPLPVAHWREARLIIAEAQGFPAGLVQLTMLRTFWDLPAATAANADEFRALLIQERARELYLEGQHLNDLRRFDLPNTPAAGELYRQGGTYGTVRCFPVPAVERADER